MLQSSDFEAISADIGELEFAILEPTAETVLVLSTFKKNTV